MADLGIGAIRMFGGTFAIQGFLQCDGRPYPISQYRDLFNVIGTRYGGDGVSTFATPNLSARVPIHVGSGPGLSPRSLGQTGGSEQAALSVAQMAAHTHGMSGGEAPATDRGATSTSGLAESQGRIYEAGTSPVAMSSLSLSATGGTTAHNNLQPFLAINFLIAWQADQDFTYGYPNPYVAEIRTFAGNVIPNGWAACDGRLIAIRDSTALFALLGTFYGGNGVVTFALPDLRGRAPMGADFGGSTSHYLGDTGGSQTVTLTTDNLPAHGHAVTGSSAVALSNDPAGKTLGAPFSGDNLYAPAAGPQTGLTGVLGSTGGGQPHNNMQPYLAVNYFICLEGVFPARP
jgi:microcystin-dependent protein